MNVIKALSIVLGASLAVPAQASIVTVSGTYEFDGVFVHALDFSAVPGGLVTISGITLDLGAGLQYDLEAGAPGFGGFAPFATFLGGAGGSTVTAPVSGSNAPVVFSFTNFDSGDFVTFEADVDTLAADGTSPAAFEAGGRMDVTISFAAAAGYSIIGPNAVFFSGTNSDWIASFGGSEFAWVGTLELEQAPAAVPEPASFALWAGLCVVGLLTRRRGNSASSNNLTIMGK